MKEDRPSFQERARGRVREWVFGYHYQPGVSKKDYTPREARANGGNDRARKRAREAEDARETLTCIRGSKNDYLSMTEMAVMLDRRETEKENRGMNK